MYSSYPDFQGIFHGEERGRNLKYAFFAELATFIKKI
jgi:hypothetical protein